MNQNTVEDSESFSSIFKVLQYQKQYIADKIEAHALKD